MFAINPSQYTEAEATSEARELEQLWVSGTEIESRSADQSCGHQQPWCLAGTTGAALCISTSRKLPEALSYGLMLTPRPPLLPGLLRCA